MRKDLADETVLEQVAGLASDIVTQRRQSPPALAEAAFIGPTDRDYHLQISKLQAGVGSQCGSSRCNYVSDRASHRNC